MDKEELNDFKNKLTNIRDNIGQVFAENSNNETKEQIANELKYSWSKFKQLLQDMPIRNKDEILDELNNNFFNNLSNKCVENRAEDFILVFDSCIHRVETSLDEQDYNNLNQKNIKGEVVGSLEDYDENKNSNLIIENYREEAYSIIKILGEKISINSEEFVSRLKSAFDKIVETSHENINTLLENDRLSLIQEVNNLLPENEKDAFKSYLKDGAPSLQQQQEDSQNFLSKQPEQEKDNSSEIKPLNTDFQMI